MFMITDMGWLRGGFGPFSGWSSCGLSYLSNFVLLRACCFALFTGQVSDRFVGKFWRCGGCVFLAWEGTCAPAEDLGLGGVVFLAAASGWGSVLPAVPGEASLLYEGGDYLLGGFPSGGAVV